MDRYQEMADLQRNWKPPAELLSYGIREVRLSRRGIGMAVLSGMLILGGIAAGIVLQQTGMRQSAEQALLAEQGQDTEATITRLWRTNSKERSPMVAYQFPAEGRIYRRSVSVPQGIWKRLTTGTTLVVRFLPADPTRNHPRDWAASQVPLWASVLIALALSATGVFVIFTLRRQLALLRDGRPAPAIVTRHSYAGKGQRAFHYEFPLLGGSVEKGKSGPRRRLPEIGATICVLYDSDNSRRNSPYPLDMAAVANVEGRARK